LSGARSSHLFVWLAFPSLCFRPIAFEAAQWQASEEDAADVLVPDLLDEDASTFFPEALRDKRQARSQPCRLDGQ